MSKIILLCFGLLSKSFNRGKNGSRSSVTVTRARYWWSQLYWPSPVASLVYLTGCGHQPFFLLSQGLKPYALSHFQCICVLKFLYCIFGNPYSHNHVSEAIWMKPLLLGWVCHFLTSWFLEFTNNRFCHFNLYLDAPAQLPSPYYPLLIRNMRI